MIHPPSDAGRTARAPEGRAYGRHDRFRIPVDDPSAFRFYVDTLLTPHSRREMLWAAIARASAAGGRAALPILGSEGAKSLRGRAGGTDCAKVPVPTLVSLLREAGVISASVPSIIALDDYGHSERGKTILFIFEQGAKQPRRVAKLSSSPQHVATLGREQETLRLLRERLGREFSRTLPEPLAAVRVGDQTAFVETCMPGRSMYVEARSSLLPRRHAERHFTLARDWLVRFHRATRIRETALGDRDAAELWVQPLQEFQRVCSPGAAERKCITEILTRGRALHGERLPLAGSHGDFWARNLILDGASIGVLDWEHYSERGEPFSDLFLFITSYGLSYPWTLGRWADPGDAFCATYTGGGWLPRLVRKELLRYCSEIGVFPKLLEILFPAFLAARAVRECTSALKGRSEGSSEHQAPSSALAAGEPLEKRQVWRRLFEEYACFEGKVCFGG